MNIKCPSCYTVFEVDSQTILRKKTINVKCSVCEYTWMENLNTVHKKKGKISYKKLIILNLALVLISIAFIFIFKDYFIQLGGYWLNVYDFIEKLVPIQ